jgi:hypothetical protein
VKVSRLGEILVGKGLLTSDQVEALLDEQAETCRPLGLLAEERYGLPRSAVEEAWVAQYEMLAQHIDATREQVDPRVLDLVTRRQAWQFQVLPIRWDGFEIMTATTPEHLARAVRFATACLGSPCYFVLTDAHQLHDAIDRHYPMEVGGHPLVA